MKKGKRTFISVILFLILTLSVWFIMLDFSRFSNLDYTYDIFPSALLKRICVVLAAAIAWSVGRDWLNPADSRKMKAAFLFAFLGEAAFAVGWRLIGVGLFAVCQTLLILRNGAGLGRGIANSGSKQRKLLYLSIVIILLIISVFVFMFVYMDKTITSIIVSLYGVLLSISLWAGLASWILRLLPRINSTLAALGMACFFCCDILVGFDAALEAGLPWLLANSFIWVFYIPALTMLSLSCYRYDANISG